MAADPDGRLLTVDLTAADISDSGRADDSRRDPGAMALGQALVRDGSSDRLRLADRARFPDAGVETIRRRATRARFEPLPGRRVVERTSGRMTRRRRLVRDHEQRIDVSQAMIYIAMGGLLLRRNAHA